MNIEKFRIREGSKVDLKDYPTDFTEDYSDKVAAVEDLRKNIERLKELQDVLYAQDIHSLLLIFQAMDAAGKDGAIKRIVEHLSIRATRVASDSRYARKNGACRRTCCSRNASGSNVGPLMSRKNRSGGSIAFAPLC